jgi:hypothetical protein
MPWVDALHHGSQDVGNYLSTLVCQEHYFHENGQKENGVSQYATQPAANGNNAGTEGRNCDDKGARDSCLQNRVSAAGALLSQISYCCGRASESDITAPDDSRPLLDVVLASSLEKFSSQKKPSENVGKVHENMLTLKGLAEKELKESFELLSKEFTAISAIQGAANQG